jgi:SAM-dependent methyltransferase
MTQIVKRLLKKFRKASNSRRKAAKKKTSLLYQSKRVLGTEQRSEMISARWDDKDQSLLDIACNLGQMTRYAADKGLLALGIDHSSRAITAACGAHHGIPNLAFMRFEITPESASKIPSFDVTLCLSVYHYWMELYGEATAWSMVAQLIERTRRKFFFEPASLLKKYGANPPPGVADLDRDGLVDYHLNRLRRVVKEDWSVMHLGETTCLGREQFRLLFMVSRV